MAGQVLKLTTATLNTAGGNLIASEVTTSRPSASRWTRAPKTSTLPALT